MGTPDKQIQTLKSIVKLMGTPDQTQEQNRENVTKIVTANIFVPFFFDNHLASASTNHGNNHMKLKCWYIA